MEPTVEFSGKLEIFDAAADLFRDVERRLFELLPRARIHHIGSTAVAGSITKGDLDVLIQVDAADFVDSEKILAKIYNQNSGSTRNSGFSSFVCPNSKPDLGIQLVVTGTELDRFLEWRDRLRADAKLRSEYDELKRRFSGRPMKEYRAAKASFIESRIGD